MRIATKKTTLTYSLQLYTVRAEIEQDPVRTLQRVADIGFTAVEPYNFSVNTKLLLDGLYNSGLTAPSGHASLLGSDQERIFEAANKLGITTVVVPYIAPQRWMDLEGIRATADSLNAAARVGAQYGVAVGYHNHEFELETKVDGRTSLEILCDHLEPSVVLELDMYWAAVGGEDAVDLLGRLNDRVRLLHVKDGPITKETRHQVAVGAGRMPVRDILAAARSAEIAAVELDDFDGDIFKAIEDSWAYLHEAAR